MTEKTCQTCKSIYLRQSYADGTAYYGCVKLQIPPGINVGQGGGLEEMLYSEACELYGPKESELRFSMWNSLDFDSQCYETLITIPHEEFVKVIIFIYLTEIELCLKNQLLIQLQSMNI